jgi:hypothetical protein
MYDLNIKSKFIHFRANGLTIKKISEIMGINRTTLIQWNKELYTDIKIAERDEFEKIFDNHFCDKLLRVRLLAEELGECYMKLANKEERADNLTLLKEIEKLTKLINMEMEDKKYYSMMQRSSGTVNKKFPVIVNDKDKFEEYDPTYNYDEEPLDCNDSHRVVLTEKQKQKMRKIEEEAKAEEELMNELKRLAAEEKMICEVKENSVVAPKAEVKRSERIINRKPDQNPTKSKKKNNAGMSRIMKK